MIQSLKDMLAFLENIKEYSHSLLIPELEGKNGIVRIEELKFSKLENKLILNKPSKALPFIVSEIEEDYKIKLTQEQSQVFFLPEQLTWTRPEQNSGEGLLKGGMFFNGLTDIFYFEPTFFKYSLENFLQYEDESKTDIELIHKLRFIESPTSLQDATYTPYFGCVTLKENEFPTDFYFYDSGLVYKLPFTTYEEYIDALIKSAAVNCWQYFYINPQEIITKNKGIKYITWAPYKRTGLDESLRSFDFNPNSKYDRLDLINEYLERCVQLLPSAFPFLNFEHHSKYYDEFKKLYEASK